MLGKLVYLQTRSKYLCYSKVGKTEVKSVERERETNLANLPHTQGAASLGREIGSYLSIERELDNTVALVCDI